MSYSIIETPDHLHRGLHVFASINLYAILDWIDKQVKSDTLREKLLSTEERWLLNSIKDHALTRNIETRRLLARKEARDFFKKYPEFRKGAIYRTQPYSWELTDWEDDPNYEKQENDRWREYEEFDYFQEIHGHPDVENATGNLRSALQSRTISAITDEIESLAEVLSESGFRHRLVLDAIEVLHDLFANGANDTSRYLNVDTDEAFEVTNLCQGRFRKLAANSMDLLRTMPPIEFEYLCAELVGQFGLTDISMTSVVADGGIDIAAMQILDGRKIKYIIQCKRYSMTNKVDVHVVRELAGVKMDARADRALVITTSEFTKPARDFARRTRAYSWGVRLIDHKILKRLLDCTD